jgi:hypothetical protein
VTHARTCARAERLPVEVIFLREIRWQNHRLSASRTHGRAHRQTADFLRGGQISLQEHRRQAPDADVVESVARVVAREQRIGVNLQVEEIANSIPVLRAVEAAESIGTSRIWIRGGYAIERRLKMRNEGVVGRLARSGPSHRGHRPCAKLADDQFPPLGMGGNIGDIERAENEITLFGFLVMATGTIAV